MDNFTFCQLQHLISRLLGTVSPRKNDPIKYSFFINEVYYIVSKVYTVQGMFHFRWLENSNIEIGNKA